MFTHTSTLGGTGVWVSLTFGHLAMVKCRCLCVSFIYILLRVILTAEVTWLHILNIQKVFWTWSNLVIFNIILNCELDLINICSRNCLYRIQNAALIVQLIVNLIYAISITLPSCLFLYTVFSFSHIKHYQLSSSYGLYQTFFSEYKMLILSVKTIPKQNSTCRLTKLFLYTNISN